MFRFYILAVSNQRVNKAEKKIKRRPNANNYISTPFTVNKKKVEKSIIYKTVPLSKDNRKFSS